MHKYYQTKRVYNINNHPVMFNNNNANISMKIKTLNKNNLYKNGLFSINSITNHSHTTDNNINPKDPANSLCCSDIGTIKPSVKTYSAMMKTRSKFDGQTVCNPINSLDCWKKINHELIERFENGTPIIKHDDGFNKSYTIVLDQLNGSCQSILNKSCNEMQNEWEQYFIDNPPCNIKKRSNSDKIKIAYCNITDKDFCSSKVPDSSDYLTTLKNRNSCPDKPTPRFYNHTSQGPC